MGMNEQKVFPTQVTELFHEIDSFGEGLFTPLSKRKQAERIIGRVTDPWTQKVYGLWMHYKREVERWKLERKFSPDENFEVVGQMVAKEKFLQRLFWFSVEGSLGKYSLSIGVREGWIIVEILDEDNPLKALLNALGDE